MRSQIMRFWGICLCSVYAGAWVQLHRGKPGDCTKGRKKRCGRGGLVLSELAVCNLNICWVYSVTFAVPELPLHWVLEELSLVKISDVWVVLTR